jgi:hypothetical protein
MKRIRQLPHELTLLGLLLAISAAKPVLAQTSPTAEDLYQRLREARLELSAHGPPATLGLYSRIWLEEGLETALRATDRPRGPVDPVTDSLWAHFAATGEVAAVYSYGLVPGKSGKYGGPYGLELHVATKRCEGQTERQATDTFWFVYENGAWRINAAKYSNLPKDLAWYHAGLEPMERFPLFRGIDRTLAFRELFLKLGGLQENDIHQDPCWPEKAP